VEVVAEATDEVPGDVADVAPFPDDKFAPLFPAELPFDGLSFEAELAPDEAESTATDERLISDPEISLLDESEQLQSIPTAQQHAANTPEESMRMSTSFELQT
jgi:hypothetical protein